MWKLWGISWGESEVLNAMYSCETQLTTFETSVISMPDAGWCQLISQVRWAREGLNDQTMASEMEAGEGLSMLGRGFLWNGPLRARVPAFNQFAVGFRLKDDWIGRHWQFQSNSVVTVGTSTVSSFHNFHMVTLCLTSRSDLTEDVEGVPGVTVSQLEEVPRAKAVPWCSCLGPLGGLATRHPKLEAAQRLVSVPTVGRGLNGLNGLGIHADIFQQRRWTWLRSRWMWMGLSFLR